MNTQAKKIWFHAEKLCIAHGCCVASNMMFETKKDHQLFLKLWDKYLSPMADLVQYHLSPSGWILMFKTKSKEKIVQAYLTLRKHSQKAKAAHKLTETKRMISEHFRILLSQFVRRMNAKNKRRGTLVLESFRKYVLSNTSEYQRIFKIIVESQANQKQYIKKYQADYSKYDTKKEMTDRSIWKVGRLIDMVPLVKKIESISAYFMPSRYSILRNLLNYSLNTQKPPNST